MPDSRVCHSCDSPTDRKCAGCSRAWYCSKKCQEDSWPAHIFDCNPSKPIRTVYYLARAARDNVFPEHKQTLTDYGFDKASTNSAAVMLLGLYQGLLLKLQVKPSVLDTWKRKGTMIQGIKAAYETSPVHAGGGFYSWFLRNQWVLDDSLPRPSDPMEELDYSLKRAWARAGGSPRDSPAQIIEQKRQWPEDRRSCFDLLDVLLLEYTYPSPFLDLWILFGFCACQNERQESFLALIYRDLFTLCTFDEIVTAYRLSGLIVLMDSKGLRGRRENIIELADALGDYRHKSIWRLKQFVLVESAVPTPAVRVDYGFVNCRNESEFTTLKELYKTILEMPSVKAVNLHHAAIRGKLFAYINRFVPSQLEKKPKRYRRLLRNLYPLAEP